VSKFLASKVAFITGGAGGIGRGITEAILEFGSSVAMGNIDQAALDQAQDLLANKNGIPREQLFAVSGRIENLFSTSMPGFQREYSRSSCFKVMLVAGIAWNSGIV
jgi:NAD(P)-dependent dehydrogenase (short-subunit alcohol dehydrogenase family)